MNSIKILIVDDLTLMRSLLKKSLADIKCSRATEASDGSECISKIAEAHKSGEPFDVVLLDWNMPGKNGLEVVQFCKRNQKYKDMPIIMITAERDKSKVIQALNAGVTDYIVKPFHASSLYSKLVRVAPMKKAG